MLALLECLGKKGKHEWANTGGSRSSTAYPGNYYVSFTCRNCWWERTFIIPPYIYDELKEKTPAEFFEGIEVYVLADARIPFHRYYQDTNPWASYYKDIRRNPLSRGDQHDMGREIVLIPGQLTEFGELKNCIPWAKGQSMQPLH